MQFKKIIIKVLITVLVLQAFSGLQSVGAEGKPDYIVENSIETKTIENGLELEVVEKTTDRVVIETEHIANETEVYVKIDMDRESEDINISGEVISDEGQTISHNYDVVVHDIEDDNFIATFIDSETGEIIDIDSTQMSASALPLVIIAAVARYGIKYAMKKYGKKAAQSAVSKKAMVKYLAL